LAGQPADSLYDSNPRNQLDSLEGTFVYKKSAFAAFSHEVAKPIAQWFQRIPRAPPA